MSLKSNVSCPRCGAGLCLTPAPDTTKPRGAITDMEVLVHAKNICPIPLTEEIIAKFTVQDGGTFWKLRTPFWGKDDAGKKNFAQFADGMKQIHGSWFSDREQKQYYFRVDKA